MQGKYKKLWADLNIAVICRYTNHRILSAWFLPFSRCNVSALKCSYMSDAHMCVSFLCTCMCKGVLINNKSSVRNIQLGRDPVPKKWLFAMVSSVPDLTVHHLNLAAVNPQQRLCRLEQRERGSEERKSSLWRVSSFFPTKNYTPNYRLALPCFRHPEAGNLRSSNHRGCTFTTELARNYFSNSTLQNPLSNAQAHKSGVKEQERHSLKIAVESLANAYSGLNCTSPSLGIKV